MATMTQEEFAEFFANASPYQDFPGGGPPAAECLYLYYVTVDPTQPDSPLLFRGYYHDDHHPISRHRLETLVNSIACSVAKYGDVPPSTGNQNPWRRKSYIAFVIDIEGLTLSPDMSVCFSLINSGGNHTFYNAWDWLVDLSPTKLNRSAFACIDYMRNVNGGELAQGHKEKFDVYLCSPGSGTAMTLTELVPSGDGNTNLGGKVPPPP